MQNPNQKVWIIFALALSGMCGFALSLYFHARVLPDSQPGEVHTIQTFHSPALFVKQIQGDPHAGEKIFKEFCSACHAKKPLIPIRAPRIGDSSWQSISKLGMPTLLKITINGAGAMPARGGCFECSDQQLQEAIKYILENSSGEK